MTDGTDGSANLLGTIGTRKNKRGVKIPRYFLRFVVNFSFLGTNCKCKNNMKGE